MLIVSDPRFCMVLTFWSVQGNADASLASGYINPTTVRQAILGANQGRNLLQDYTVKVGKLKGLEYQTGAG